MTLDRSFVRGWLQAFFDGEGTCTFRYRPGGGRNQVAKVVAATSTDYELIERASEYLSSLGIEHRLYNIKPQRSAYKPQWKISIQKYGPLKLFRDNVGFHTNRKMETLNRIVAFGERKRIRDWHGRFRLVAESRGGSAWQSE